MFDRIVVFLFRDHSTMAVQVVVSKNTTFPVGKPNALAETALDHVNRILKDHDYTRCASPAESKSENTSLFKGEETGHHNDRRERTFEVPHGLCVPQKSKVENGEQLPNEGIEASDLSSLLEQFLEYEQASNQSTNLLTPATSPGHSEPWNEQVYIKIDSHVNSTDLTPPTTPPVSESVEHTTAQMDCDMAVEGKHLKESAETLPGKQIDDHCLPRKRKSEDGDAVDAREENGDSKKAKIHFDFNSVENNLEESSKACGEAMKEGVNKVNDTLSELQENEDKEGESKKDESNGCSNAEKSQSNSGDMKIQSCDLHDHCEKDGDKLTSDAEATGDTNLCKASASKVVGQKSIEIDTQHHCKDDHKLKKENIYTKSSKCVHKDERQRRRQSVRRHSTDESSDDERYNPRGCEKSKERYRETSRDSYERERRHDRHRRSSREDSKYDHNRNRRYSDDKRRKYDNRSDRNKRRWKSVRDIEQERKIDFRLGRSFIKDVAKEERRVVYVGGLPYGTTRDELWNRLRRFGPVEEVTVHLREGERENYGFVTFFEPEDARQCIERGNSDPKEPRLDLCFGGRRQYCGGSYVDFDSKTSHIEELSETYGNVRGEVREEDDFDTLLRKYEEEVRLGKRL